MDVVVIRGTLLEEPIERTLASGVTVTNWEVRVVESGVTRVVPVQWEDASRPVQAIGANDEVIVLGLVRRRYFKTGGVTAARTEVLGRIAAKPTQKVALKRLLESGRAAIS